MKKTTHTLLFLLFSLVSFSQQTIPHEIASTILETNRNIKIYLPEGYEESPDKNYPLTLVLDEAYLFDLYVANAVLFAKRDKAPQQIVVGISMEETKGNDISFDIRSGRLSATASRFYQFLRDEVLLYIESTYRTSPFISVLGQNYSANFITHFLQERKPFINAFICINPSFSDFFGQQLQSYNMPKYGKEDNTFYFYSNNSTALSAERQLKIDQIQQGLTGIKLKNFNVINDVITTPSPVSAVSEAIPRALTKIFEIYSSISKEEYDKNIKDLSPEDAIYYLENKYLEIQYLFGSNLGMRQTDIFAIENIIIEKENGDKLRDFGQMILNILPSSPLGEYYIGRYYESGKMYKKALKYYKIGYGKMDPSDPNFDAYYENIIRVSGQ